MDEDATWYGGRTRRRRHCVRWEPRSPSPKSHSPQFSPMSVVAKRLDGLRCHLVWGRPRPRVLCVRWGPSYPQKKGIPTSPNFGPSLLWGNGWLDEDATWYGSRTRPRPHCVRRGPVSPRKGHSSPSLFSVHVYCGHGRPSHRGELLLQFTDEQTTNLAPQAFVLK